MGLLPSNAQLSGSIRLDGRELIGLGDREASTLRGKRISMVFQEPLSALTPVYTIGDQIAEAVQIHHDVSDEKADARAVELLDLVGIPNPRERAKNFPHEFSGGMRQRAMIAMAIANDPDVIIADEPTTALDVTIQAQILDVLQTARRETGAAIIMITHDLGVVAELADDVIVMYGGKVVEQAGVDDLFTKPEMPYTWGLLGSLPRLNAAGGRLEQIPGQPPSLLNPPSGCPFHPRCEFVMNVCRQELPALEPSVQGEDHLFRCHLDDESRARIWDRKKAALVEETAA
jgi:peptide/nickel transport system ATP-binding protein